MVPKGILQLMIYAGLLNYIAATTDMISMHCKVFSLHYYINIKPSTEDLQTADGQQTNLCPSCFAEYNKSNYNENVKVKSL